MWLQRAARWIDESCLGWPFQASWPARAPAGVLDRSSPPSLDPVLCLPPARTFMADGARNVADRTPECGADPGQEEGERTPQPTPKRAKRTPRRALHWYEEPTYYPEYFDGLDDNCTEPLDVQPIALHTFRLALAMAEPSYEPAIADPPIACGRIERGLFAYQIEQSYYAMCATRLWWRPHRWGGTNGVAQHLRQLLYGKRGGPLPGGRLPYKYLIRSDGSVARAEFYPLPKRTLAFGPRLVKGKGKRTPKKAPPRTRLAKAAVAKMRRAA